MSEWSRNADWERFLRETIKLGDLPSTQFAKDCGIPFGAWLEMANKANRIGKTSTIKWATESLEKITKKEVLQKTISDEKDQELADRYTIITNLGWSKSAFYIVNADERSEILRWGEKALTFLNEKEAKRFAREAFSDESAAYRIERIDNWENEGGHLLADSLSFKDGHLMEIEEYMIPAANSVDWDTDREEREEALREGIEDTGNMAEHDNDLQVEEEKITYAKNIEWDTDGENPEEIGLPDRILIPAKVAKDGDEAISDFITQETGYCHKGFEIEKATKKNRTKNRRNRRKTTQDNTLVLIETADETKGDAAMEYTFGYRFSARYRATVAAPDIEQARKIAEEKYNEADFGQAEDIDGSETRTVDNHDGTFEVTFRFSARYIVTIAADNLQAAMEQADDAYTEADFGQAEDIDGNLRYAEDAHGHRLIDNREKPSPKKRKPKAR